MTDEMLALARRNADRSWRDQRRVPEGPDRGDPVAGGLDRRRDQQLRRQPRGRQAGGLPRDRARAAARRAHRHHRHRCRGRLDAGAARRAWLVRRLHRRRPLVHRVRVRPARRRPDRCVADADAPRHRRDAQRHRAGHQTGIAFQRQAQPASSRWRRPAAAAAPAAAARESRPGARRPPTPLRR